MSEAMVLALYSLPLCVSPPADHLLKARRLHIQVTLQHPKLQLLVRVQRSTNTSEMPVMNPVLNPMKL